MKSEIYRQLYDFEMAQRDHLIAAVNIPIIAITALGSALVAMALGFPYSRSIATALFVSCSATAAVALLVAIANAFRSILGYEYARTTSPKTWQKYYDSLLDLYAGRADQHQLADSAFERAFNQRLSEATDVNKGNNRLRGHRIILANLSTVIALSLLAVAGVSYVIASAAHKEHVYEVRIVR